MKKFILTALMLLSVSCGAFAGEIVLQDDAYNEKYLTPYISELEQVVKVNWEKPTSEKPALIASDKTAVVKFDVQKDGSITNLMIVSPSGDDKLDTSVLSAVQSSAPFKPLPAEYLANYIEVQMTFESKLLKKQYISPEFF